MVDTTERVDTDKVKARKQSVSLYPEHLEAAEQIRQHYRLRSMASAIQRAIEDTAAVIRESDKEPVAA